MCELDVTSISILIVGVTGGIYVGNSIHRWGTER